MRKTKGVIGIVIIVVALGAMVFWESMGRDALTKTEILIAKEDIDEGAEVLEEMLVLSKVETNMLIDQVLGEEEVQLVTGKIAKQFIPKNSQISKAFLYDNESLSQNKESIFAIKPEWIDGISSSVRRGDMVSVYSQDGQVHMGQFRVAFVKDRENREIKNMVVNREKEVLERIDAEGSIMYIEILANLEQYGKLAASANEGQRFLIVQEM